ncbi:MAG: TPM domain-containing protein [Pseudomonadota bacterium]
MLLGWCGLGNWAVAQVPVPPLTGHVVDTTGTLTAEQTASLEQALTAFEARKGSQLAVLLVDSVAPEAIEPFALRVAEQWKLGRKKVDDGAILVVAKKDRAVRIEVGYGLEGVLTDLTSKRIISELIVPRFQAQDYHGGITAAVAQMMRLVDGEALPAPANRTQGSGRPQGGLSSYAPLLFILALGVGGVLRAMLGKLPGALVTGGVVAAVAWFVIGALSIAALAGVVAMVFTLVGGGRGLGGLGGGVYGGGRGGFGGGGFGGGGGFSGGGGGFGGGGASGRW